MYNQPSLPHEVHMQEEAMDRLLVQPPALPRPPELVGTLIADAASALPSANGLDMAGNIRFWSAQVFTSRCSIIY